MNLHTMSNELLYIFGEQNIKRYINFKYINLSLL